VDILLTCAGRRNYLVSYFREALGAHGHVYTADASATAPAMQEADQAFVVPSVDHPDYFDSLFEICRKHQIRLLIPLNDIDLPLLAQQSE
jgi:carbamoyl-phosphate synthase large subunit